jgi:hypothetical protein
VNPFAAIFLVVTSGFIWHIPRKWVAAPLLAGTCYMTLGQGIEIGVVSLPIFRLVLLVGLARIFIKREYRGIHYTTNDYVIFLFSSWLFLASFFHDGINGSGPVFIAGQILNFLLVYILFRTWIKNTSDIENTLCCISVILLPLAITMSIEHIFGKNLFAVFGGVPEDSLYRNENFRAQGSFRHPILAGTVGATSIPLFCGIFEKHRKIATIGIISGLVMVITSSSSGPILSLLAGLFALSIWKMRSLTPIILIGMITIYMVLDLIMQKPPYYFLAKIDISGGSTGWHRAFLIEQTFKHFDEWWIFGTDQTRHWMPYQGIGASNNHTDITNYFIGFAVVGGLPALIGFILILTNSFMSVGRLQKSIFTNELSNNFIFWSIGSSIFAQTATCISVSYFDQSLLFIWFNIAVISSAYAKHIYTQ